MPVGRLNRVAERNVDTLLCHDPPRIERVAHGAAGVGAPGMAVK